MATGFEDIQKYGRDNVEVAFKSVGALSKGIQAIAAETADYSKRTFEEGSAALEKLLAVSSVEKAVEVQSDFVKSAYEGYVGQVTKFGEIFADIAKTAYQPYESLFGKFGK